MLDDHVAGRFDPAALLVKNARGADGTDYGVGGGPGVAGFFDDAIEGVLELAAAAGEEAGGDSVAVEGDIRGYVSIFEEDPAERNPVDVGLIDVFAVGAIADLAFAGVACGFWNVIGGIFGGRLGGGFGRFFRWVCGQDG